jgi:hypothetical protein
MMDVVAPRHRTRLRHAAGRYRDARRSLHTPSSAQSRRGLDWMNFFIADVQTGFGTFVAFYLAQIGWSQGGVGIILAAGGLVWPECSARYQEARSPTRSSGSAAWQHWASS